jgi:methionyl aminopeptidase
MDGAPPFGAAACVSVNDEIVHGLPGDRRLADGDVVTIDVGVRLDGWCADAAHTVVVGRTGAEASRLVETGDRVLGAVLAMIRPGVRWSEASDAGDQVAREAGLLTLRGWAGHGVGRCLHEAPALPMRPRADRGEDAVLEAGMTLAIEPILALPPSGVDPRAYADGSYTFGSAVREDGWTVVSLDGWLTCHFEHTVAVTSRGAVVLTAA